MQRDSIANRVFNAIKGTTIVEKALAEVKRKDHNERLELRARIETASAMHEAEIAQACAASTKAQERIADLQAQIATARNDHRDAEATRLSLEMRCNGTIDRARTRLAELADPRIKQMVDWLDESDQAARASWDVEKMAPARTKLRELRKATWELQYQAIEDVGPVLLETRKQAELVLRSAGSTHVATPILEDAAT